MIKHVVCFKLNNSSVEEKEAAKEILMSMVGNVPTVLDIEVGTDFLCSDRSFDIFLQVTLKDRNALDEYQKDEYHCNVVKELQLENTAVGRTVMPEPRVIS